jgi:hypothetical protein
MPPWWGSRAGMEPGRLLGVRKRPDLVDHGPAPTCLNEESLVLDPYPKVDPGCHDIGTNLLSRRTFRPNASWSSSRELSK